MLAELAGNLPSGSWQKSTFGVLKKLFTGKRLTGSAPATKPPKMGARGSCWPPYTAAVRLWGNCLCFRIQVLEKPFITLEDPGAEAVCAPEAHNREASHTAPNKRTRTKQPIPPVLSLQHPLLQSLRSW